VNLIKDFPTNFTPTHNQTNAINAIDQAFADDYKFVILRAPTGSGKSFISKTIANSSNESTTTYKDLVSSYLAFKQTGFGYEYEDECINEAPAGCFALTVTKTLQDQYKQFFDDTKILKGKNNYYCNVDKDYSVTTAPCVHIKQLKDTCWRKDFCSYYKDRNDVLINRFATLNYSMFFSLPAHVKKREYLVCDEASELEDELVREFTCTIDLDFLDVSDVDFQSSSISTTDYSKSYRGVEQLTVAVVERVKEIDATIRGTEKLTTYLEGEKKKMIGLKSLYNKLQLLISSWNDSEYIIERVDKTITFTPLKVNKLAKYLFDHGNKIVLMSATIIDEKSFAKTLGVDRFKFIDMQSTFDSRKAPIYVNTKHKLNAYTIKSALPTIADMVKKICDNHANDKGIIHTHTLEITKAIKQWCGGGRFLYREQGVQNDEILKTHFESAEPTILVSPSLTHGIDLKDDLARFQIIVKAPYLPLTNKRIKMLFDGDKQWYQNKMLCSLVQACGRGVRSANDHCVTYILDATVLDALRKNINILPKHFIDRFV
jgi:Rad3-related DNA helicase